MSRTVVTRSAPVARAATGATRVSQPRDELPPPGSDVVLVISNIVAAPGETTVTISWDLSDFGTGQVEWGATTAYGNLTNPELSFDYSSHSQGINGLTPSTTYHYRIHSRSVDDVETVSSDQTFTTDASAGSYVYPTTRNPIGFGPASSTWSVPGSVGGSLTSPDFDGDVRITRISDVTSLVMSYPVLRGWAVDDAYFIMCGNTRRVYNGAYPHAVVRSSYTFGTNTNAAIVSGEDPDLIYGLHQDGNWLRRYHISTDTAEVRRTFSNYTKVWASDSSTCSDDDRILLKGQRSNGTWWLISYDIAADTITAEVQFNHPANGQNLHMKNVHTARSGLYGIVTYGANMGYSSSLYGIYTVSMADLSLVRALETGQAQHMAPGIVDSNGRDCIVKFPGYMQDIITGQTTDLFPYVANKNNVNTQHVNAGGTGWATFSHGQHNDPNVAGSHYGYDMIYSVRLDGSGDTRVWTYAHAVATAANYVADTTDPYASLSRSGHKVAFKSRNLGPTASGTAGHIYIAERV